MTAYATHWIVPTRSASQSSPRAVSAATHVAAGQAAGVELVAVAIPCRAPPRRRPRPASPRQPASTSWASRRRALDRSATPFSDAGEQAIRMRIDVLSGAVGSTPVDRASRRAGGRGRTRLGMGPSRRTAWRTSRPASGREAAIGTPTFLARRSGTRPAALAFADPEVSGGVEVDCGVHRPTWPDRSSAADRAGVRHGHARRARGGRRRQTVAALAVTAPARPSLWTWAAPAATTTTSAPRSSGPAARS